MRFLALETDIQKLKNQFLSSNEQEVMTGRHHPFSMIISMAGPAAILVVALLPELVSVSYGVLPPALLSWAIFLWMLVSIFYGIFAYFSWRYDFILVTIDKLVIVDQSLIYHRITPVNLNNVASVEATSAWWNIFNFGTITFHVKGLQPSEPNIIRERYIVNAAEVVARITDALIDFQRRSMAPSKLKPGDSVQQTKP